MRRHLMPYLLLVVVGDDVEDGPPRQQQRVHGPTDSETALSSASHVSPTLIISQFSKATPACRPKWGRQCCQTPRTWMTGHVVDSR
jgi:hypothetical protein